MSSGRRAMWRPLALIGVIAVLAAAYFLLHRSGLLELVLDGSALRSWMTGLGLWGPVAVVGLMTLAILVSPIPSAPIAVAAGAAYGHTWGTLYVMVGAVAGAFGAFALARLLGFDLMRRWFGERLEQGWLGSQGALMAFVFVSRLLPFVSFDLVSYAAGLSVLAFWRFALATVVGVVPASFLLAHVGDEMATGEDARIMVAVVLLGAVTLIPLVWARLRRRRPAGSDG